MRVLILGAGPAGLFAALRLRALRPDIPVTVLESSAQALGKVRISGGGRCNVTHHCPDLSRLVSHYPRGGQELRPVLKRFDCLATRAWFEARGVALKTEGDGRVFPVSDRSQSILDCLLNEAERTGVEVVLNSPARSVNPGFQVDGRQADRLLLATGSSRSGYRMAADLGHTLIEPVPSLFTFTLSHPRLEGLQGVSLGEVAATLADFGITQGGPLLITHWGLSGPAVLRLSAWGARELAGCNYRTALRLDLLPRLTQEQVRLALLGCKAEYPKKQMKTLNPVGLPRRFWERWAEDRSWGEVSDKTLNRLSEELKRWNLQLEGKGVFKEEFVTAGGVPLGEVQLATMESRPCPGLFLAGEILDVDGVTGGFNFQSAWATGWVAGEGMAQSLA